ncbi:hypothetical protein G3O08_13775 [Cryomorpha ignava]|uniref:Uncharacterized protein n=1 Tax=Cryomorpha ignava TaxID=101383 RepID=A0A7K3WUJ6_9FLAO|nr:hypothetical protein [Cryomorpha ignava]NEN24572.1 hypothetical protein [Cryomorpha ignava]
MYNIVDCTVLKEETDFNVTASINSLGGSLELECKIPIDRKIALELLSTTRKNLVGNRFYKSGEKIEIPLQQHNADSFTLEISDENGNAITRYRIMRSYC